MDPFGILDAEDRLYDQNNMTEETFQLRYGWEDIKSADPLAVYPYEDQMETYEKRDRILTSKVHYRDHRLELTSEDLQKLESIIAMENK